MPRIEKIIKLPWDLKASLNKWADTLDELPHCLLCLLHANN